MTDWITKNKYHRHFLYVPGILRTYWTCAKVFTSSSCSCASETFSKSFSLIVDQPAKLGAPLDPNWDSETWAKRWREPRSKMAITPATSPRPLKPIPKAPTWGKRVGLQIVRPDLYWAKMIKPPKLGRNICKGPCTVLSNGLSYVFVLNWNSLKGYGLGFQFHNGGQWI